MPKGKESESDNAYFPLRSVNDLQNAGEWLFNKQKNNEIDGKAADALNTTLKGSVYLGVKLKLDVAKLYLTARKQKIDLPPGLLPTGLIPGE